MRRNSLDEGRDSDIFSCGYFESVRVVRDLNVGCFLHLVHFPELIHVPCDPSVDSKTGLISLSFVGAMLNGMRVTSR